MISLFNQKMNAARGVSVYSKNNTFMRTSEGEIDYNKVLEVIDSDGVKNYTFIVKEHSQDDFKTFHNFVICIKPSEEVYLYLLKYGMDENFAEKYLIGESSISEFYGVITKYDYSETTSCAPNEIIIENPNDNTGGGSSEPDPNDPVGGGNTGNPNDLPNLSQESDFTIYCDDEGCNASFSSWEAFMEHCGTYGESFPFTVVLNKFASNSTNNDPCLPDGDIGVLIEDETPCSGDPIKKPKICPSSPNNTIGGIYGCTRNNPKKFCEGYIGKKKHGGIDISGNVGDKIFNMHGGTVVDVRSTMGNTEYKANSLGNYIEIESIVDGKTIRIKYCHLGNVQFQIGDAVSQSIYIGNIGRSGNAAAPGVTTHLHIQSKMKVGSIWTATNPINYFNTIFNPTTFNPETDCN